MSPKPTGQIAVSSARLPALLDSALGRPRGQGLAGRRQGVDLASQLCLGREKPTRTGEKRLRPQRSGVSSSTASEAHVPSSLIRGTRQLQRKETQF